jgi:general secretion pathway protein E
MGARTTITAMLDSLDPFSRNIVAFERRHVADLSSIEQNDIDALDAPLADVLKNKLLQDYDLMALGEVPDRSTALLAITAAQRDQLFIARLETSDAVSAVGALLDLGVAPDALAGGLHTVLAQRLVRVLCRECRMKVAPSTELLQRLHLDPARVTHLWEESAGCEACGRTGFNGRTGIFELWRPGDESRALIAKKADAGELHAAARQDGMTSLQIAGLRLVLAGVTSLRELARVLKTGS